MNKTLLSTALVAVIAAAAFVPAAHAANSGTINISGMVIADTCKVDVNGGATVALPTATTAQLGTVGATFGDTNFNVNLTDCDALVSSASMAFSGSNIDTNGNLNNAAAGGSTAQVQLLTGGNVINMNTQDNAPTIAVNAGSGSVAMSARYYAKTAATTAGLVQSSVSFTLTYL